MESGILVWKIGANERGNGGGGTPTETGSKNEEEQTEIVASETGALVKRRLPPKFQIGHFPQP